MKNMFPSQEWNEMSKEDQNFFREMSEDDIKNRWDCEFGQMIIDSIIEKSFNYVSLIGTVKADWGKNSPKTDLRGINLSELLVYDEDEVFSYDFSNCLLHYSNFSNTYVACSNFSNSDILYSNFSDSSINDSNFSNSNLTLSIFDRCNLEYANFKNSWLTHMSVKDSDLGYIKYNNKTDFHNFDINSAQGLSNPLLVSFINRKRYLKHYKEHSKMNKIIYYIWLVISDCGQSLSRWFITSLILCFSFGLIYTLNQDSFIVSNNRELTDFTFYYYSVITFTTLGYGDIVPKDLFSEIVITIEVFIGYLMLGGLISIFGTKFIPKQ